MPVAKLSNIQCHTIQDDAAHLCSRWQFWKNMITRIITTTMDIHIINMQIIIVIMDMVKTNMRSTIMVVIIITTDTTMVRWSTQSCKRQLPSIQLLLRRPIRWFRRYDSGQKQSLYEMTVRDAYQGFFAKKSRVQHSYPFNCTTIRFYSKDLVVATKENRRLSRYSNGQNLWSW